MSTHRQRLAAKRLRKRRERERAWVRYLAFAESVLVELGLASDRLSAWPLP